MSDSNKTDEIDDAFECYLEAFSEYRQAVKAYAEQWESRKDDSYWPGEYSAEESVRVARNYARQQFDEYLVKRFPILANRDA